MSEINIHSVTKEEEEDNKGTIRYRRFKGIAKGKEEFLYPTSPEDDGVFPIDSGFDVEGKEWFWRVGEKFIDEGFGSSGGWYRA